MLPGRTKLITPPSLEPVSLEEALLHCHVDEGDEDAWFNATIQAARIFAEEYQGRSYLSQTWELTFDSQPDFPILLPRCPVISVESIKIYDTENVETSLALTDFLIDTDAEPAMISLNYGIYFPTTFLREYSAVKIRYTTGFGTAAGSVPKTIKNAILLYIGYLYENRAGEVPEAPRAFLDLLRPNRMYT